MKYESMIHVTKVIIRVLQHTDQNTYRSGSSTAFHVASGSKSKVNIFTFWPLNDLVLNELFNDWLKQFKDKWINEIISKINLSQK
ncbi:MAG: hypothetical protein Q8877_02600, partial [Sweet potato little leaf phytoplasma]|nr:hypothetical protein [Sweet potato little leaf phytoplasma]